MTSINTTIPSAAHRNAPGGRSLARTTFRTSRLLEFCNRKELVAQTGLIRPL